MHSREKYIPSPVIDFILCVCFGLSGKISSVINSLEQECGVLIIQC